MNAIAAGMLAAHTFGRVKWLGSDADYIAAEALLLGNTRGAPELERSMRRLVQPGIANPALASDLDDALEAAHFDAIVLFLNGCTAPFDTLGHILPLSLFAVTQIAGQKSHAAALSDDFELADAHVHSGASIGMETLIRMLIASESALDRDILALSSYDLSSEGYSVGVILGAIRHAIYAISQSAGTGTLATSPGIVAREWHDGRFWQSVRNIATKIHVGRGQVPDNTWSTINEDASELLSAPLHDHWNNPEWNTVHFIKSYVTRVSESGDALEKAQCRGLITALTLLNVFLRSAPGEGLPAFVDRFEQMGLLRDSLRSEREDFVTSAVDYLADDPHVIAIELRKTVTTSADRSVSDYLNTINVNLRDHLRGFAKSSVIVDRPCAFSMPVTFFRGEPESMTHTAAPTFMYDLASYWQLANAITSARAGVGGSFISAVDVVGNELSAPNWIFVPLLRQLGLPTAGTNGLVRCCHAGESFRSRLEGLRSVGELLLPDRVVDRIGHALALGDVVSDFVIGTPAVSPPTRSIVDDLIWLTHISDFERESLNLLDRILSSLNLADFGVTSANLVSAWNARRSIEGFVQQALSAGFHDPPAPVDASVARIARGTQLSFLLLTHRSSRFPFNAFDYALKENLLEQYNDLSRRSARGVVSVLKEILRDNDDGLVVECCPSSNMRLSGVPKLRYLPAFNWVGEGLSVSLNSDDPLIFGNTVSDEARLVASEYGEDLLRIMASVSVLNCSIGVPRGAQQMYDAASQYWV